MLKEKQIEEMAEVIRRCCDNSCKEYCDGFIDCEACEATLLYNAGYRKQSEGHWFIREYEYFTCSECGHDYYNGCEYTKQAKERLENGECPNFCPNCGAKMTGGKE